MIDKITEVQFNSTYEKFMKGEITRQFWNDYCGEMLLMLIEKNQGVFTRLKERS